MAVPKKRRSKAKKRTRRAAWKAVAPEVTSCKNCQNIIKNHCTCQYCGFYKGDLIHAVKFTKPFD